MQKHNYNYYYDHKINNYACIQYVCMQIIMHTQIS